MHRSTLITRELRTRAIKALGGMCKFCAHSEPLALHVRCHTSMQDSKTAYKHYKTVLKPGGNKYLGYYLCCANCHLAGKKDDSD